jgi:hypothetical protein
MSPDTGGFGYRPLFRRILPDRNTSPGLRGNHFVIERQRCQEKNS